MPLEIVRGDIVKQKCDIIVNAANDHLQAGSGVCGAVFEAAGRRKLQKACDEIGYCPTGKAVYTNGFALCPYIVHAVGPVYRDGRHDEESLLRSAYVSSLEIADKLEVKSIAFPLLSAGVYGYPKDEALQAAIAGISDYLAENETDLAVRLVIHGNPEDYLSEKQREFLQEFDQEEFVEDVEECLFDKGYAARVKANRLSARPFYDDAESENADEQCLQACFSSEVNENIASLESLQWEIEEGENFQDVLFALIDEKEMLDTEVYKRSNIDRKTFSKLRSPNYHPSKKTVLALTIGLRADLQQAERLLESAGYAFAPADLTDQIVKKCIVHQIYNIGEVNEYLFIKGQKTLGC